MRNARDHYDDVDNRTEEEKNEDYSYRHYRALRESSLSYMPPEWIDPSELKNTPREGPYPLFELLQDGGFDEGYEPYPFEEESQDEDYDDDYEPVPPDEESQRFLELLWGATPADDGDSSQ